MKRKERILSRYAHSEFSALVVLNPLYGAVLRELAHAARCLPTRPLGTYYQPAYKSKMKVLPYKLQVSSLMLQDFAIAIPAWQVPTYLFILFANSETVYQMVVRKKFHKRLIFTPYTLLRSKSKELVFYQRMKSNNTRSWNGYSICKRVLGRYLHRIIALTRLILKE